MIVKLSEPYERCLVTYGAYKGSTGWITETHLNQSTDWLTVKVEPEGPEILLAPDELVKIKEKKV